MMIADALKEDLTAAEILWEAERLEHAARIKIRCDALREAGWTNPHIVAALAELEEALGSEMPFGAISELALLDGELKGAK